MNQSVSSNRGILQGNLNSRELNHNCLSPFDFAPS